METEQPEDMSLEDSVLVAVYKPDPDCNANDKRKGMRRVRNVWYPSSIF